MKKLIFSVALIFVLTVCLPLHAQWAMQYGGSGDDWANSVQQTSDGGYIVTGGTKSYGLGNSDIWVLKLSLAGDIEWQRTFGGTENEEAYAVQETSDGEFIVVGYTDSFGAGMSDSLILKLNADGDIQWQYTCGRTGNDWANSVQQTSDGGYIVGGSSDAFGNGELVYWILKLTSAGSSEWQYSYSTGVNCYLRSVQETSDGGYIVAGHMNPSVIGSYDLLILKLDSIGLIEWQRYYGGVQDDWANSIEQTADGGYFVAGYTGSFGAGGWDFWAMKLDSIGDIQWERTYGRGGDDWASSAQQTSDRGYIVAGYTDNFGAGFSDFWVIKLSPLGVIEWQAPYGGVGDDAAFSVSQTDDAGFVLAGATGSNTAGGADILVLKLYSDGTIDPACELPGSSNAIINSTAVAFFTTLISPLSTSIVPQIVLVPSQESDSDAYLICEDRIGISGAVRTEGGAGIENVTIAFSGGEGTATTDVDGNYSHEVGFGWSGTATPSKDGYEFSPESREYTEVTSDQTDEDYTGYFLYVISGLVTDGGGGGIDEVTLTFSNSGGEAITAVDGSYTHTVREGWTGDATPSKACYTSFVPSFRHYDPVFSDQAGQDYTGTYEAPIISGTISMVSTGIPVSGVVMSGLTGNPTTDASGYYESTVDCLWSGTVIPTKDRTVFSPRTRNYSDVSSSQTDDYTAYTGWLISGVIQTDEGITMSGVAIDFTDDIDSTATITGTDGSYSHMVRGGRTVTVTPGMAGYVFTPDSRTYPDVSSDITGQDYTGSIIQHTLTINADEGGATQPVPGTYSYDYGTEVSVTASSDKGYEFAGWSGDVFTGHRYNNPVTITMDSDKSLTALFDKTGLCFIASAAYGKSSHPHVEILRDFRDVYLMRSPLGRKMVEAYYRYSPDVADIISKHVILRMAVRIHLVPVVALSYAVLRLGPELSAIVFFMLFALPAFLVLFWRRRSASF